MTLISPSRGAVILHTHISQFANLLGGVEGAGEDIRLNQRTNASDYANVFGNVDTTNGYAAKFQYGPAATPTTLMTVSKATGVAVTQNSATVYALSVTQSNATNLIQKWVDSAGVSPWIMTNQGLFSIGANSTSAAGPGIAIGNGLTGYRFRILTALTDAGLAATGLPSHKVMELTLSTKETGGGDNSVASFFLTQSDAGASSGGRAVEAVAAMPLGTAGGGFFAVDAQIATMVPSGSATAANFVGVIAHADSSLNGSSPFSAGNEKRADIAFYADGKFDGFWDYFRAKSRWFNGGSSGQIAFRVAGGAGTDQDGDIVTIARLRAGNGSVGAPAVTFNSDLNNGLYLSAADQVSMSTNGTERTIWAAAGSVRVAGAGLVTTATDGFVHIPFTAGAPTGVPTAIGGVPMVFDATNNKLMIYDGGWIGVVLS